MPVLIKEQQFNGCRERESEKQTIIVCGDLKESYIGVKIVFIDFVYLRGQND